MKIVFKFDKVAIAKAGLKIEDVHHTVKKLFAEYDLPCVDDAAEAYEVLAEILREGFPVCFHFDDAWKHLTIFRFRPKNS